MITPINSITDPWDTLGDLITKLSAKNDPEVIVGGEFNAHTAGLDDTIKRTKLPTQIPKALDFPPELRITNNHTDKYKVSNRNNMDTQHNTDGKQLIDLYC